MSENNFVEFLDLLDEKYSKKIKVDISSKKTIELSPLNFKQQKQLITSGLNGLVGVMQFVKNLNEIILNNSAESELRIYDRIPIILALRKNLYNKPIQIGEISIEIDDVIKNFEKYEGPHVRSIEGIGYVVNLKIPTLMEENKFITGCIEEIKKNNMDDIGNNASIIISYEIPKFIESISYGDRVIDMYNLASNDRNKIINALPATITNDITEFIIDVREYDEKILTVDDTIIDIDYTFFE